jgi:hypothetical protein
VLSNAEPTGEKATENYRRPEQTPYHLGNLKPRYRGEGHGQERGDSLDTIAHDVAREAELDRLITKRHERRVSEEGERAAEELWRDSVRRYNARQDAENREAWAEYHASQAERLRRTMEPLIAFHEARAQKLGNLSITREPGDDAA